MKTVKAKDVHYEDVPLPTQKTEKPLPSQKAYYEVPISQLQKEQEQQEEIEE